MAPPLRITKSRTAGNALSTGQSWAGIGVPSFRYVDAENPALIIDYVGNGRALGGIWNPVRERFGR